MSEEKTYLRNPMNKGLFRVLKKTLENTKKLWWFAPKKGLRLFISETFHKPATSIEWEGETERS